MLKIFVDNPFPIKMIKQTTAIRCLDLNCDRTKLAVVDENADCLVYDVQTKELLYKEPDVNSVSWNSEIEDMVAMSGKGTVTIKIADFVMHTQKQAGFVVGFSASKLFCLQQLAMQVVDVPQSQALQRCVLRLHPSFRPSILLCAIRSFVVALRLASVSFSRSADRVVVLLLLVV